VAKSGSIRRVVSAAKARKGHDLVSTCSNACEMHVSKLIILLPSGKLVGVMQSQHRFLEAAGAVVNPSGALVRMEVRHLVNQFAGRRP
jgi:hypothetical protein